MEGGEGLMEKAAGWFTEDDVSSEGHIWFVRWASETDLKQLYPPRPRWNDKKLQALRAAYGRLKPWSADLEKHLAVHG